MTKTKALDIIRQRAYDLDNDGMDHELREAIDALDQGEFWSEIEAFLGGK